MKGKLIMLLGSFAVLIMLPVLFKSPHAHEMGAFLILLLAVFPVWFAILGFMAGREKKLWPAPLGASLLFMCGMFLAAGEFLAFAPYAASYALIAYFTFFIRFAVNR